MKILNWETSKEDYEKIATLARIAHEKAADAGVYYPLLEANMDLTAVHCNGCPLDLDAMLANECGDVDHDLLGIRRHLNRQTGQLEDFFVPRYALNQ